MLSKLTIKDSQVHNALVGLAKKNNFKSSSMHNNYYWHSDEWSHMFGPEPTLQIANCYICGKEISRLPLNMSRVFFDEINQHGLVHLKNSGLLIFI